MYSWESVSEIQSIKERLFRLRDALKRIGMHLRGYVNSHVEMLKSTAAEKQSSRLSLAVRSRLTVLTAGHKSKHDACRAVVKSCVGAFTYRTSQVQVHLSSAQLSSAQLSSAQLSSACSHTKLHVCQLNTNPSITIFSVPRRF